MFNAGETPGSEEAASFNVNVLILPRVTKYTGLAVTDVLMIIWDRPVNTVSLYAPCVKHWF